MCGICGFVSPKNKIDHDVFEKMIHIIEHRGPDDAGSYYGEHLALGHRRLSIIDLSKEGHQPFHYKNRYIMVFNGEIYNYLELKKNLEQDGYQFQTKTDTEVLVAMYDRYQEKCVEQLNGMWAFCIYDKQKNQLFCSRDRFGVKPFYYTETSTGDFIFGSEIKQILEGKPDGIEANRERLLDFLILGALDHTNETMFRDILQLRGGHNLIYDLSKGQLTIQKWYDLAAVKEKKNGFEADCRTFEKRFDESVALRLRSDVPVGSCLSGGLDSSAIVTVGNRLINENNLPIDQYSVSSCFNDARYDERDYIEEVVNQTGTKNFQVFPEMDDLFSEVDKIIWHMDEPFGSTSIYAQWSVFKEAKKQGLTVMLDGQGADEQLAGYTAFYQMLFVNLLRRGKFITFFKEVKAYKQLRGKSEVLSAKILAMSSIADAFLSKKIRRILRSRYKVTAGSKMPFNEADVLERLNNRKAYDPRDSRQYILDSIQGGMSALLHYEDRDSMAHSVESRVPFLDYRLVEAIYAMPLESKINHGITKAVLREGLKKDLPEKIRTRYSKLGFVTPEDKWMKENHTFIHEELMKATERLAPILEKNLVDKWYTDQHQKIKRGDFMTWRIICAGRWAEIFNVSI